MTTTQTSTRSTKPKPASSRAKKGTSLVKPETKTEIILSGPQLDAEIRKLNENRELSYGDRLALLDKLFAAWPRPRLPELYETEVIVLPSAHRAIAVSGQTVQENSKLREIKNYWPLIEIYEIPASGKISDARLLRMDRFSVEYGDWEKSAVLVSRHVEILGPCEVVHDPTQPIEGLARRACVMRTKAPLRVHVDTIEQAKRNGVGHPTHYNEYNRTGRFGC